MTATNEDALEMQPVSIPGWFTGWRIWIRAIIMTGMQRKETHSKLRHRQLREEFDSAGQGLTSEIDATRKPDGRLP